MVNHHTCLATTITTTIDDKKKIESMKIKNQLNLPYWIDQFYWNKKRERERKTFKLIQRWSCVNP